LDSKDECDIKNKREMDAAAQQKVPTATRKIAPRPIACV
jgi:hypothetical protein